MKRLARHCHSVEASVLARVGLANGAGAVLSFVTANLVDAPREGSDRSGLYLLAFVAYMVVMVPIGGFIAHHDIHGVCQLADGPTPITLEVRRSLLRVPFRQAGWSFLYWVGAATLFGALNFADRHNSVVGNLRVSGTIVLGGFTTAGVAFLLLERALRSTFRQVLATGPADGMEGLGIRTRLLVSWALGSVIPLLIIALAFVGRSQNDNPNLRGAVWTLTAVAIIAGAVVIITAARSVSEPLEAIRDALARVELGDLDADVVVDDAGEIGLLQTGFNGMVAGLRDRRALEDLFGRHVGTDVARHAREEGVSLGGERREASAMFVDLVGSSALAQSRPADEVVTLLNRFFAIVVERVEHEGGWVNKFEGDAALCVFGAPAAQPDHATRALRAARTLRRDLLALAVEHPELNAAIGVSSGHVAAGNVGAAHRYEYTVIGDPVNEAARLTEHAKSRPGGVLASEDAIARAGGDERRRWIVADELSLRGRQQPTLAYEPSAQSTAGASRSHDVPAGVGQLDRDV